MCVCVCRWLSVATTEERTRPTEFIGSIRQRGGDDAQPLEKWSLENLEAKMTRHYYTVLPKRLGCDILSSMTNYARISIEGEDMAHEIEITQLHSATHP